MLVSGLVMSIMRAHRRPATAAMDARIPLVVGFGLAAYGPAWASA